MKKIFSGLLIAGAFVVAGCSGSGGGKPLSDYKGASQADSLSYYYGAMYADNYWRSHTGDSVALSDKGRDQYMSGLEKGLSLGSDEQYLEGVMTGLQFAMGMRELEKELGVKLDPEIIRNALAYGLRSDSAVNPSEVNGKLQQILQTIGEKKDKENSVAAEKAGAAAAKKAGASKMTAGVYGKVLKAGSGAVLKDGDRVKVAMKMTSLEGKDVAVPMPEEITVGREFAGMPVGEVLVGMHAEESVELYVSAFSMFGQNCSRMGFDPASVIRITLTTCGLLPSDSPVRTEA